MNAFNTSNRKFFEATMTTEIAENIEFDVTLSNDISNTEMPYQNLLLWNYHTTESKRQRTCSRLLRLAHNSRWSPDLDIDWREINTTDQFPCTAEADPFCGFEDYDRLGKKQRIHISWQRHGMEISEILHGEQLALMCCAQLVSLMPCLESRLFAGTQAADEARHAGFFRRYLDTAGLKIHAPGNSLQQLTTLALQTDSRDIKLLICHLLIESLAMAQFRHLIATHTAGCLTSGLRRIIEDEARHVKFGSDYLKSLFAHRSAPQLGSYGHFVVSKAFELAASDNNCVEIARQQNWHIPSLRRHLRRRRIQNPQLFQQRFRQLRLNLAATGLLDSSVELRLRRFTGVQ